MHAIANTSCKFSKPGASFIMIVIAAFGVHGDNGLHNGGYIA